MIELKKEKFLKMDNIKKINVLKLIAIGVVKIID